uniref:prolyl oligopeptidase family serine peptidase n=1 Tax=Paractinoplanes polyasparticus TaxID=2856853 RepID=UPI001C84BE86|nr:prolyl oligopeptidase family serine peptidase [Actinoplanes polyasparticus]
MATPISRRSVLAAGAGAAAGLALPGAAAQASRSSTKVRFTLGAETLDGGEQVTSVTLRTGRLGRVDPAGLTTGTFTVHAKATSPIPLAPGDLIFSEYDLDRTVTAARVGRDGDIVLDLAHAEGQIGGGTLGYIVSRGRNVQLDLVYTITQNSPVVVRGRPVTFTSFEQGRLSNPEVDAFSYHTSGSGMNYRLYSPSRHRHGRRPLVVWLHGGGEGGSLPDNYYDNETPLRANRGALGFATREAQHIFDGAYVVAPQSQSFWLEDGDRFAPQIRDIIRDVARRHPIDRDRISVVGCSNGGYMSLKMTVEYPDLFASSVPICGVVQSLQPGGGRQITDAELQAITTPTWLVTSRDDTTVPPEPNTVHAHDLIPGSLLTLYDNVTWDGHRFAGHWSWIYVARNDPRQNGLTVWQWMARQRA